MERAYSDSLQLIILENTSIPVFKKAPVQNLDSRVHHIKT